MNPKAADVRKELLAPRKRKVIPIRPSDFLSTGSTLFNLALSGLPYGGVAKGCYLFLVGDSDSGKSWITLSLLAEAHRNKSFDKYRMIHDNAENGALMDVEYYFGKGIRERMEPPSKDSQGRPRYSTTVEEFAYSVDTAVKKGRPFIYLLDSMDALGTDASRAKFEERKDAHETGEEVKGSYGVDKAKENSAVMRQITADIRDTGSILVVISQTRDKIGGFGSGGKTRGGGHALEFYAHLQAWTSVRGLLKRTVKGKEEHIGNLVQIRVKRSRVTGRKPVIEVPIYHSLGIDETGSCVQFLIDRKHWKAKGDADSKMVVAPEFDYEGSVDGLIRAVEAEDQEPELQMLVTELWTEIEKGCEVTRKPRYS